MSQEAKAAFLGTGIAFHGPTGTGKLIYSDGRENFDSPEVTRSTAFVVSAICYACIQWKADNIAEAPLRVARLLSDGSHEFVAHPLNELLQEPSEDYDMAETLWLTVASLEVFAKSLWVKDRNRVDQVGQLVPFNGQEYSVEADNGRIYGKYHLETSGPRKTRSPDEVVAFRYLSPYDRYDGVSPTDAAIRWLNLGSTVETSVRRLLLNGMFPSVVISPDKDWKPDKDEFDLFKQTITNYQTGPANSGKPFVALGGSKVTRVAFSLRDLLPDEIMDRVEASASMAYGIPPVVISALVGLKNSPWSQMREARRAAYDDDEADADEDHPYILTISHWNPLCRWFNVSGELYPIPGVLEGFVLSTRKPRASLPWALRGWEVCVRSAGVSRGCPREGRGGRRASPTRSRSRPVKPAAQNRSTTPSVWVRRPQPFLRSCRSR